MYVTEAFSLMVRNQLGQRIYFPAQRTDSSKAGRRAEKLQCVHGHLEFVLYHFIHSVWLQVLFITHWVRANVISTSALGVKLTLESRGAARGGERESLGQRKAGGPHLQARVEGAEAQHSHCGKSHLTVLGRQCSTRRTKAGNSHLPWTDTVQACFFIVCPSLQALTMNSQKLTWVTYSWTSEMFAC